MSQSVTFDAGRLEAAGKDVRQAILTLALSAGAQMASTLRSEYPTVTGHLRRGVRQGAHREGRGAIVQTTAPHAHLYELGTQMRQDATRKNKSTGRMPARHVFVAAATRTRASFARDVQALLDQSREIV